MIWDEANLSEDTKGGRVLGARKRGKNNEEKREIRVRDALLRRSPHGLQSESP